MKVLFLTYDYLTQPLGIASLASALKQEGHTAEVVSVGDHRRQEHLMSAYAPDILCLSMITGQHTRFVQRARFIRNRLPGIVVLAGGPHATFYPECIEESCLDAVCRGEGDIALPRMVSAIAESGELPAKLENWWIKRPDGAVSKSEVADPIEDLDTLPFPSREPFDRAAPERSPVALYVMTSRGCPYNCSYCFNHAYRQLYRGSGKICRRRSVSHVLSEIEMLKGRYPLQIVVFQDDTFNLNKPWLNEFLDRYPSKIALPFHCHLRADLLDEESARRLAAAGCISVKLGLESGSERVRNGILHRGMSLAQFERACDLLQENHIRFASENILGIPGTTLEDDLLTYEVNRRARPDFAFASLMQVYPRTDMAAFVAREGLVNNPIRRFPESFYEDSSVDIADKPQRGRLRALFALCVGLHVPTGWVSLAIRIPLRKPWEFLDRLWKGYCLRFRLYPCRQSARSFAADLRAYLANRYF
jgi:radical SAM superfamily enzyme YgiQ (UPF0313 family)